ncbi:MAG: DUF721 domain-containing protein [Rikenellaceae bacterium]|nr:DUF721 domain-containing protein [Rikenellaceae bacterium]
MRRCYPVRIGDLWQGFKSDHPDIERKIKEGSVGDVWRTVVGDRIADATEVKFMRGVLYATVRVSVLRHELFMNRENIRHEMNAILGEEIVGTIIVK